MLFDGSAIFKDAIGTQHNIDAVFVKEDGKIVFSVFGDGNPLTEDDTALRSGFYVDDSWEGALDGDSDGQDDGETVIESAAVIAGSIITTSMSGGLTGESSGVDVNTDNVDDDRPLITSAPCEGFEGSVLVEFNLFDPDLPYPLDFLSYDWRSTVETDVLSDIEDGNYVNNPRGQINVGSYRGHDKVINWQEIYKGPTI
jgi:hypothetical protein